MTPPKPVDLDDLNIALKTSRHGDYWINIPYELGCNIIEEIEYLRARVKELEDVHNKYT